MSSNENSNVLAAVTAAALLTYVAYRHPAVAPALTLGVAAYVALYVSRRP